MKIIRAVVVDDEKPGRERLRRLLSRHTRVELAGCCASGAEALTLIHEAAGADRPVHVMFLDVQMPEVDGFTVISSLVADLKSVAVPSVVFVTAHDEYALRAFDSHAIDYLLKPFSDERFQAALDRVIRHVKAGHAHALMSQMHALLGDVGRPTTPDGQVAMATGRAVLDRIVVKGAHRVRLLPVEQISWIEADGMYVKLHTRDGAVHLHRGLLGSLGASLDERRFVRIHRSAIVNIDLVDGLRRMRTATTSCFCATAPRFASADGFARGCRRGSARLCSPPLQAANYGYAAHTSRRRSSNCRSEGSTQGGSRPPSRRAPASEALMRPSAPAQSRLERRRTVGQNSEFLRPDTMPTYACLCCGHTEAFETAQEAFEAGWDVAPYFTLQPLCNLCLSAPVMILGLDAARELHADKHAQWQKQGRPTAPRAATDETSDQSKD